MATFVIGDVQGCYDELMSLLTLIDYDPQKDTLWFTGDLVNRGPKSLEVLRFVASLPHAVTVLGNHDLTLLTLAYTDLPIKHHNLHSILAAPDRQILLEWLRRQPLLYEDRIFDCILVHAGIYPQWTLLEAKQYAKEVEHCLQSNHFEDLLQHMFGNEPHAWSSSLGGWDRLRFIINAFTRMRFCDRKGNLDLKYKGNLQSAPAHLFPWYELTWRSQTHPKILFGHWAALEGQVSVPLIEALDTGCIWGKALTALRLEDGRRFSQKCLLPS